MKKIKIVSIILALVLSFVGCNVIAEGVEEAINNDSAELEIEKEEELDKRSEGNKEEKVEELQENKIFQEVEELQENKEEVRENEENKEEVKTADENLKLSTEAEMEEGERIAEERLDDSRRVWWTFIVAVFAVTVLVLILLCFIKVRKK